MAKQLLFSVTLADCKVDTFTVGGNGGGGKDTSNTGVRITHPPSGAVGRAVDSRSQLKNKQLAFRRMGESKAFQAWAKNKANGTPKPEDINMLVDSWMTPDNLLVQVWKDGSWQIGEIK